MRLFPSDRYPLPLPEGHRFPAAKYRLLRERLEAHAAAGAALEFVDPHAATDDELLRVHDRAYVGRVLSGSLTSDEVRRIGFPWSRALVERSLRSTGAAVDAAAAALEDGVAASLAGGTHHAGTDFGEGYCVFNDTAVAAREMQARGAVRRVLILDCDVHQGNGTAQIFAADPSVFTMSIHGARNFPLRKHPGTLDVPSRRRGSRSGIASCSRRPGGRARPSRSSSGAATARISTRSWTSTPRRCSSRRGPWPDASPRRTDHDGTAVS